MFLLSCATRTDFRPNIKVWINRLIALREKHNIVSGWLFPVKTGKLKGQPVKMNYYEDFFHEVLTEVKVETDLIPEELEVVERYHISRSF